MMARALLLLTVVGVVVSSLPASDIPEERLAAHAADVVVDDSVSLLQEAKRSLDEEVVDLGSKGGAAEAWGAKIGRHVKAPASANEPLLGESSDVATPANTADKIDFEIQVSVIAKNDAMVAISTDQTPQQGANKVYEIMIGSVTNAQCCIRDKMEGSNVGCVSLPAAARLKWDKSSNDQDSKNKMKMWDHRDSKINHFKIQKIGRTIKLFAMYPQGAGLIASRTFAQGLFPARYVSVATAQGSTGVWVVCAKECKRLVYTNEHYQYVSVTEIQPLLPVDYEWRAEFWPEINKKSGMTAAVTLNGNNILANVAKHTGARTPWTRMITNTITFSPGDGGGAWTGLDAFKYESGEEGGSANKNPLYVTNFAAKFKASIMIPTEEEYFLYTWSDDGVAIKVGDKEVHAEDGIKRSMTWKMSEVKMAAGANEFEINYYQASGTAGLWVMWSTKRGAGKSGKCATDSFSTTTCSKAPITLPMKIGGAITATDFAACGAEGGSVTIRAFRNLNMGKPGGGVQDANNVESAMTLTERNPDKVFVANSIFFENTASYFPGLDGQYKNNFALKVDGFFKAKKTGKYKFWLVSDDGSQLWIDNRWFLNTNIPLLIDNDGTHTVRGIAPWAEKVKEIELEEGYYRIGVFMFDVANPSTASDLEVYVQTPSDFGPRLLNCDDLTHSAQQDSAKWAYRGCYQDMACDGGDHDLPIRKGQSGISTEQCYSMCTGYRYFAQQRDRECWCGNHYGTGNPPKGALEYKPLPVGLSGAGKEPDAVHYKPKGCKCDAPAAVPGIGLCKLCVYERKTGGEKDLAFGSPAEASSAPKPEEAWRAVDGLTNHGAFINQGASPAKSRSMACTAVRETPGQDSWWRVDFGTNQRIEAFAVTGLSDGMEDSSSGWEARVGGWANNGKGDAVCKSDVNAYKGTHFYQCEGGSRQGRFFSLWKYNANMVICEVQVYGDEMDLAFGKPTEQSSMDASGKAERALDGNTDGNYAHASCTHTDGKDANPPWWKVDLTGPAAIESVTVWNRADCCGDRLYAKGHEFEVRVGDAKDAYDKNAKCGDLHTIDPPAQSLTVQCDKKIGQYVWIDIPQPHRTLTLCEVRVVGAHVVEDVAENKPCGQSSNENCERAVDGNTDGKMTGQSCTMTTQQDPAWWYVDLQDEYKVSEVQVWGRTDCCGDRLSNFQVRVGDNKPSATDYAKNRACNSKVNDGKVDYAQFQRDDPIKPSVSVDCNREPGTYVSINIPDRADYLTLCEVKVFGQVANRNKANLALNRPASQIDTGYGGVASRAVDGNTETSFGAGSCTHTNKKEDPWWKVDLQKSAAISRVIVWNRSDCCGTRLEDFEVRVGEMEDIYKNAVCGGKNKVDVEGNAPRVVNCEKKTGRYVSVDLKGKNQWLTLCEVKVNGEWAEAGLQLKKECGQSSTANSGYAKRAVDGNTDGKWDSETCTQTNTESNPYWYVDLGKPASISKVTVFNRADCCGDRIANFEVRVGSIQPQGSEFTGNPTCGSLHWPDAPKEGGGAFTVDCDEAIGRYVVVDLPGDNKQLTLCEVQVTGAYTTPAYSKCKQSAEAIEADLEKVKADEKAAKTEVAKLKVDHGDLVKKLNDDLLQARSDEAGTKKDAHSAAGDAADAAMVTKSSHDEALAQKDQDIAKFKADAAASAKQQADIDSKRQAAEDAHAATQAACTKKKMEDATMIEDLKKTHTEAAKKCLDEAKAAKAKHDTAMSKKQKEVDDEKKAHEDSVIAHADDSAERKEKCSQKQQDAREEGRKAGLQACPGVNGLMREIWRLRQKLGASEAANSGSSEEDDEEEQY